MTDIRVGDLVKATRKDRPEATATDRVLELTTHFVETEYFMHRREDYDFEVLDRPAPPIDEEMLKGVLGEWRNLKYRTTTDAMSAVINYVREYDQKNATKESK